MMERRIANSNIPQNQYREKKQVKSCVVTKTNKTVTIVSDSGKKIVCENVSHIQTKMFLFSDGGRLRLKLEHIDVLLIEYITQGLVSGEIKLVGICIFDEVVDKNDRVCKDVTYLKYDGFVPLIFQRKRQLRIRHNLLQWTKNIMAQSWLCTM